VGGGGILLLLEGNTGDFDRKTLLRWALAGTSQENCSGFGEAVEAGESHAIGEVHVRVASRHGLGEAGDFRPVLLLEERLDAEVGRGRALLRMKDTAAQDDRRQKQN
jgi:hypothetical protein